jgi:hypothetical protein
MTMLIKWILHKGVHGICRMGVEHVPIDIMIHKNEGPSRLYS